MIARRGAALTGDIMIDVRWGFYAALLTGLLRIMPAAAAGPDAAGIVMKVTGQTTPELPVRTEIPVNTAIKLGPAVELTFLHYRKCRLVTVAGGTLELSDRDFTTDGTVEKEVPGPCARVYQLVGSAGGWVARDLPPRLPVNPEIIFAGAPSCDYNDPGCHARLDGEPDERSLVQLGRRVLLRPGTGNPRGAARHRRRAGRGHRRRRRQPRSGRARLDPAGLLRPLLGQ